MSKQRTRMMGPETFRIIAALFVFLMHSLSRLGTYYGPLQALVSTGGVYMTGFFMLSGFMNALGSADRDFTTAGEIKRFLKRRLVSLMPLYLFLAVIHVIETYGTKRFVRELYLIPVEFTGAQTLFQSMIKMSHNGGTWFISCLLVCTVLFPYLHTLIRSSNTKSKVLWLCGLYLFGVYALKLNTYLELTSLYGNPFFRLLEFTIGVFAGSLYPALQKSRGYRVVCSPLVVLCAYLALFWSLTIIVNYGIYNGDPVSADWLVIPLFLLILCGSANMNIPSFLSGIVGHLGGITYGFYLAQFYCFWFAKLIAERIGTEQTSYQTLGIALVICLLMAEMAYLCIQKPVRAYALKHMESKDER